MMTEGREVNLDQITRHVVHPALHQDYVSDFWLRRVNDIAPTLTSPILAGIASSMHLPGRPMMPKWPETPEVREGLHGGGGALTQSAAPGPSHLGEPMETEGEKLLGVRTIDLDATILADLPKDPADIVILDDDELSFPGNYPEAVSTPLIEVASDRKRSSEDTSPHTSPRANCFLLVFAVSGPFTSRLAVCICFSWFSRSEVCTFVLGNICERFALRDLC